MLASSLTATVVSASSLIVTLRSETVVFLWYLHNRINKRPRQLDIQANPELSSISNCVFQHCDSGGRVAQRLWYTMGCQLVAFLSLTVILFSCCAAQERTNATRDLSYTDDDSRLCFVKTLNPDGRVIAVTSLGDIPHDDAARFDNGIIWRRPSRMGRVGLSGGGRGMSMIELSYTCACRKVICSIVRKLG